MQSHLSSAVGKLWRMAKRQVKRSLDPFEQCARDRLEPILGPLRVTDPGGGPQPVHDFEADLPGGLIAAIEVTSENESARLELESMAQRLQPFLTLPGSKFTWLVGLHPGARLKDISSGLRPLMYDMEKQGRQSALSLGTSSDLFAERLRKLGVEYIYPFPAKPGREGAVILNQGFYGGWGWDGAATGAWLAEFLASPRVAKKLDKLSQATDAAERHLVIVLHPFSKAGLSIPAGLTDLHEPGTAEAVLPRFDPLDPLTNLWLVPTATTWAGLSWARGSGWEVLAGLWRRP
jgi:hypothetical protein